jgi:anti-sigma factor RsiW
MSLKLDGALGAEQERALRAHLETCSTCQAEWEAMQFVSRLLAEQPMVPAPDGFVERFERRLAAERTAGRRGVLGVFAVVLGAFSLVTLGLSSLALGLARFWPLLVHASLWESVKNYFGQIADVALAVGEAFVLLAGSLFDLVGGPILLVYMLAVALLTTLGSRVVLGRVRAVQPVRG